MPPVTIRMTETMGRGVFAARSIASGEILAEFHTIRLPVDDVAATKAARGVLMNYWFEDDADGSALIVLGWLELVNHKRPPNLDRLWRDTPEGAVVTVIAARDIKAGEQLYIDYRFDPAAPNMPAWA